MSTESNDPNAPQVPALAFPDVVNPNDPRWMNAAPLPEPVNAFSWGAQVIETFAARSGRTQAVAWNVQWLRALGQRVNFNHVDPTLMLSLCKLALDMKLRHDFVAVLHQVETITVQAQQQQQGG